MKLEVWHSPAGYELATRDEDIGRARGELRPDARLVRVIEARSWESASQEFLRLLADHAEEDRAALIH